MVRIAIKPPFLESNWKLSYIYIYIYIYTSGHSGSRGHEHTYTHSNRTKQNNPGRATRHSKLKYQKYARRLSETHIFPTFKSPQNLGTASCTRRKCKEATRWTQSPTFFFRKKKCPPLRTRNHKFQQPMGIRRRVPRHMRFSPRGGTFFGRNTTGKQTPTETLCNKEGTSLTVRMGRC